MGHNKSVWFVDGNKEYIEEQAKTDGVSFNKKINEVITKDKLETEKEKV